MPFSVLLLAATLLAEPAAIGEVPLTIVVNASNPVTSLTREEISRLFLRKQTRWGGGLTVEAVQPGEPALQEAFARAFHGKSREWIERYWLELEASGRGRRPVMKLKEAALVEFVAKDAGAIGYLGRDPGDPRVKVIRVTP